MEVPKRLGVDEAVCVDGVPNRLVDVPYGAKDIQLQCIYEKKKGEGCAN